MTTYLDILVGGVATWRLTHMFLVENGPFRIFRRLRELFGVVYAEDDDTHVASFKYEITTCPWCLSIWVGTALTLLLRFVPGGRWWLSPFVYSATSIIIGKQLEKKMPGFSEFRIS